MQKSDACMIGFPIALGQDMIIDIGSILERFST
jgi:hypothetical protein